MQKQIEWILILSSKQTEENIDYIKSFDFRILKDFHVLEYFENSFTI